MENRRSKDDEVPARVWEAMETQARKIGVAKIKRRRSKGRSGKETRREREKQKKNKREKNSRCKKANGGMGNMGRRRRGSEVGRRSEEVGTREISQVD